MQAITRTPFDQAKSVKNISVLSINGSTDWRETPRKDHHV
jgi:hypothetical protein